MTVTVGQAPVREKQVTSGRAGVFGWGLLVVVLFCLPLFVGLGRTDLENDESIYSFAVDLILQTGDWLTPRSIPNENEPFLEKPPLKFWMVAAPIRLGLMPHDEFGLRFWDALMGSVAFLYVFALGRRLSGPLCGVFAVLVLFAHQPLVFTHGLRSNAMESAVVLAYCGGIYHFLAWRSGRRTGVHLFALALYFVLAFMTKFVAALFLPLVLAPVLLSREARAMLRRDLATALAAVGAAAALIAPWFLYQFHQFGPNVWKTMFGEHVVTRFTAYLDPLHLHPWHFYLTEMLNNFHVSGALVAGVGFVLLGVRAVRTRWMEGAVVLLWFGIPLCLISLLSSKLYHYAYPFLPPVALGLAYAATTAVRLAWSVLAPLDRANAWHVRIVPRFLTYRRLPLVLLAVAASAAAVAIWTQLAGGRAVLAIGDVTVFRNASVLRAWLIAACAVALSARAGTALRTTLVVAVTVLLVPVVAYGQNLLLLPVQHHPLRSLRDCLQPIVARSIGGKRGPGVWAEARQTTHVYSYYLRSIGPWELRDYASDPTVYMHLFLPSKQRPVLLSQSRMAEFTRRVSDGDVTLIEQAARKAGVDRGELLAAASQQRMGFVESGNETIILPGPYAACAPGR